MNVDRIIKLYQEGVPFNRIAEDKEVLNTFLRGVPPGKRAKMKVYETLKNLVNTGTLERRPGFLEGPKKSPPFHASYDPDKPGSKTAFTNDSPWEEHLHRYESLIGAPEKRKSPAPRWPGDIYDAIVISDTHVPEERMDYITELSQRHAGLDLYIAGDINDFAGQSKYMKTDWDLPNLRDVLARTDAMLEFLSRNHKRIYILFGNHDLRLPRSASRVLGPDFYWLSQEFLIYAYEKRHGVHVIRNPVEKMSGKTVELFYWHQINDCLITHAECAGGKPGASVSKTHNFFQGLNRYMDRPKFNVVIQAHSHKVSYHEDAQTGCHLFEIGTLGDISDYVLHESRHGPPQHGAFYLRQEYGITQINKCRLYRFPL